MKLVKVISYSLVALILGYLVGDEVSQRMERTQLRSACYQLQVAQIPMMNDYIDFRIKQMCRINIP